MSMLLPFNELTNSEIPLLFNIVQKPQLSNFSTLTKNYPLPSEIKKTNKKDTFSILTINSRSLNKNFDKLKTFLTELEFDPSIICVSETWINQARPLLHSLNNYSFINQPNDGHAGGAGIFINKELNFNIIEDYSLNLDQCEDIWINLQINNKTLIICSIYRHPTNNFQNFQQKFLQTIETLNSQNKTFIISGDLNINLLSNSKNVKNYNNEILSSGTLQLVKSPTHISHNYKTLIDHVYTNIPEESNITINCISHQISDHIPILTSFNLFKTPNKFFTRKIIRDMKKFNIETFRNDLNSKLTSLPIKNSQYSGNELWNQFHKLLIKTYNNHAPLRIQTRKEYKRSLSPWISKEILNSIKIKQKLYQKALTQPNIQNWTKFRQFRNKLSREIHNTKQKYFKNEIQKHKFNSRKTWKTLNNIINFKKNINPKTTIQLHDNSNSIISNQNKVSNKMNNYFTQIGSELSQNIVAPNISQNNFLYNTKPQVKDSFFLNPITIPEIIIYIRQLNSSKATKTNDIPIKLIKQTANIIAPYLALIFNKCISEGIFPDFLKSAEVIPIFKNGNKFLLNNYRPISILSAFAKIFERHIHNELTKFIKKNKILHKFQYGFRNNSSTEMAITQITEDITNNLQSGQITCTIFLDLKKAFDTVDHQILLSKLHNYGIRGLPAKLINNYLTNRTQQTIIGNSKSNITHITCGVPQGSILAPTFFNLYINDIINCSNFSIKLFADDACLTYSCTDPFKLETNINKELIKINTWRKINKLSVNFTKSNYMIFTNRKLNLNFNIIMDGNSLNRVKETKYLGVIMQDNLKWNSHIQHITNKISKASYILVKIRHYVDLFSLKMLYNSLIKPHLNYCMSVWGGAPKSVLRPLITLQKKIVRIMTHSNFDHPSAPLFLKLNILPFKQLYEYNISNLMHKIHNNLITGEYNLTLLTKTHNYNTRSSSNLNYYQTFQRLNLGLQSFLTQGIKFWNKLSISIKSLPIHLFKKKLRQYLINSQNEEIT